MSSTNLILFIGRLGHDAKIITSSDKPFISFSLCELGSKEPPTWIDVTKNFQGDPPKVVDYLKKGTLVQITGTPYVKSRNGETSTLAAFANNITILSTPEAKE